MTSRTETPTTPTSSRLLQCSAHSQTLQMVRERWDQVAAADLEPDQAKRVRLKESYRDLTLCACCSGPAKYEGVSGMTFEEIDLITPLCSRCAPKEATS